MLDSINDYKRVGIGRVVDGSKLLESLGLIGNQEEEKDN